MATRTTPQQKHRRALSALRSALAAFALDEVDDVECVHKRDAAYRVANTIDDIRMREGALDEIDSAWTAFPAAREARHELRQKVRAAEIERLRAEERDARKALPSW